MCGDRPVSTAQNELPACIGMRLVDGHVVRPQELGPICLSKPVQIATCPRRQEHHLCLFWYASG